MWLRQQEIYPENISLCPNNCKYNGIDYDKKRTSCICNSNLDEEEEKGFIEEVETNFFVYILDMINYKIITCYDKLFVKENYFYNFGFYLGFLLFFSFIFLSNIYCIFGTKSIRRNYLRKKPNINEIKEIENNFNQKIE